jgi:hypothetical protein
MPRSLLLLFLLVSLLVTSRVDAHQGILNGGLTGAYFANPNLQGTPSFTRNDVRVRFAWNGAAPGGSQSGAFAAVPATGFSARWTGSLLAPGSGAYTFSVASSGPARLWLTAPGGSPVEIINYAGAATSTNSGQFILVGGQIYAIQFEFQDMASPAVAQLSWASPGGKAQVIETADHLGVNMTSTADWDGGRIFADAMRQSRGWCVVNSNCASLVPTDAQGWPTTDFLVIPVAGPTLLDGIYRVKFRGLAQVYLNFGYGYFIAGGVKYGATLPSGAGYDPTTNTTTAFMAITPTTSINVFINFTQTQRNASASINTGITEIHMMRPTAPGMATAYAATVLFNGALETVLAPFTTIRFMDYFSTNANAITTWSQRTLPATPSQAVPNGGAIEYAVMLANETGKDLWINIPLGTGPDYFVKLAQLLRYGSDGVNPYTAPQANPIYPPVQPNLDVYLEYSNEVWNFSFPQASANLALAEAEVAQGGSPLNFDGSTNVWYWGFRRVANEIVAISNAFRGVWGNAAMGTQIRPVLEWQGGNGQATADNELQLLWDYYDNADGLTHVQAPRPPSYYVWGAGGAWYYTVANPNASTLSEIYASGVVLPNNQPLDTEWAHAFGLAYAGYEGGFEVGGDNPTTLQLAAEIDPAATAAEAKGLNYYTSQTGGDLAMIYTVAGNSSYGLADPTVYNNTSPKLQAVAAYVAASPPGTTLGTKVAGPVTLTPPTADAAHEMWGPFGARASIGVGCWLNWTLNVATPGTYTISTDLGAVPGEAIFVDGLNVGNSGVTVALAAGLHGVHVRYLGAQGAITVSAVTLTPQ